MLTVALSHLPQVAGGRRQALQAYAGEQVLTRVGRGVPSNVRIHDPQVSDAYAPWYRVFL
jgi:hypothetical protein